ncbi:MAG: winged helix-turn-helix transcriptional regulator [Methanobacteriota archaeon]
MSPPKPRAPVRARILEVVRRYPGIHVREIERQLGVSSALASYHVRKLAEAGRIRIETQGEFHRCYAEDAPGTRRRTAEDERLLGVLRQPAALKIVLLLLSEERVQNKDVAERLGITKGTASYHLANLVEEGIVRRASEGRGFELVDAEGLHDLLADFSPAPGVLEEFAALWDDLYG